MTHADWPQEVVGRTRRVSERRRLISGGPGARESALAASRVDLSHECPELRFRNQFFQPNVCRHRICLVNLRESMEAVSGGMSRRILKCHRRR